MLTQQQYNLLLQNTRKLNVKIDLLNELEKKVGKLEGVCIGGSASLQGDSNYRRNCSIELVLNDSNLIPSESSKIWLNKRIQIFIGLTDFDDNIEWFNMGKYAIQKPSLKYGVANKTISLSNLDYMAFLDGILGGQIPNKVVIPEGVPISQAIKSTVQTLGKITKVLIDTLMINDIEATVPFKLEFTAGSTVYDIVKKLSELYTGWEFFFNENGYFIFQKIPDRKDDPIIWDFNQDKMKLNIDFTNDINFENVKNSIYIWGKVMSNALQASWVYRNRWARDTSIERNLLVDKVNGDICHVNSENKSYMWDGSIWILLDFTVIPKFNIENISEKKYSETDDNLFNENQCKVKTEYILWKHSNLNESIGGSCVPIYGLDINKLVAILISDVGIDGNYVLNSVNIPFDVSGNMSFSGMKMYY